MQSRACRGPPARPSRGRPGRRRALLRPFRLLGGEDRRPCACPVPSSATGCWPSNSCPARSRAPAGCCAHPAGRCSQRRTRRVRRITLRRMSWTPGAFARRLFRLRPPTDMTSFTWRMLRCLNGQCMPAVDGPIVMIGFGSIGKGTLPLIERHFSYDKKRFVVIDPDDKDRKLLRRARHPLHPAGGHQGQLPPAADAAAHGRRRPGLLRQPVGRHLLARHHGAVPGDRRALHRHRGRALAGFYFDTKLGPEARSNYALREAMLAAAPQRPGGPTAVSCCGANPGMVSWFVKQALLNIASDIGLKFKEPKTREDWARLAMKARRQGHPHRRARHPARQAAEAA